MFKNKEQVSPSGHVDGKSANIYLSKKLVDHLSQDIEELFFKYGHLSFKEKESEEQMPSNCTHQSGYAMMRSR